MVILKIPTTYKIRGPPTRGGIFPTGGRWQSEVFPCLPMRAECLCRPYSVPQSLPFLGIRGSWSCRLWTTRGRYLMFPSQPEWMNDTCEANYSLSFSDVWYWPYSQRQMFIESWENFFVRGLVKFALALAYHLCLNLPRAFLQPGKHSFGDPCSARYELGLGCVSGFKIR